MSWNVAALGVLQLADPFSHHADGVGDYGPRHAQSCQTHPGLVFGHGLDVLRAIRKDLGFNSLPK